MVFEMVNVAHIVLLPKRLGASSPNDFHPISLVLSFSNIISNLLARRLVAVYPMIVGGK